LTTRKIHANVEMPLEEVSLSPADLPVVRGFSLSQEVHMASTDTHVLTRPEVEEALARYCAEAKAAFDQGNLLRWIRRHEQINAHLAQWEAIEAEDIGARVAV
jgi:hypothetical protein